MAAAPSKFETGFVTYQRECDAGSGGAGAVFIARDEEGERFAIKCLSPSVLSTDKRKRFRNEINFGLRSDHPNIIKVLGTGAVTWGKASVPFYVMPLMDGTLRKLLSSEMPRSAVLQLFLTALDGIEFAHNQGVVHRDLKPENILYSETANALLIADFGIARFEEDDLATAVRTQDGQRLANFRYAAPEQRERAAIVDQRSDIYALGLILNEIFTGKVAEGVNYKKIGAVASEFAYLDSVIERALQNDPTDRYQSVADMKLHISALAAQYRANKAADASKRIAVNTNIEAPKFDPVEIIDFDWRNEILKVTLNREPEAAWQSILKSGNYNHNSYLGSEPQRMTFSGRTLSIPAAENVADKVLTYLREWMGPATRLYEDGLKKLVEAEQQRRRDAVAKQVAGDEARARVLARLAALR